MPANYKYPRLAVDIKEVLTQAINDDIEGCEYVSITEVELTKDLGDAKIYFQTLDDNSNHITDILNKNKSFLKSVIADNIKIRRIPNLIFKYDNSLDNYNHIDNLLNDSKK